jgi:hypothetical protein
MKANQIFLVVIIYLFPLLIYGQSNYIETDSVLTIGGIEIIDGKDWENSEVCQVKMGGKTTRFSPLELEEYGFTDGRIYVSKNIHKTDSSTKRVFLERLVKGNITLYYYKGKTTKTFYLERDSSLLIELPKTDKGNNAVSFHETLLETTSDCQNISEATKLVSYNKKSFTKLIQRYNSCKLRPFPFLKYGLIVGYAASKISFAANSEFLYSSQFDYKYDPGITLGIFIDNPVFMSDFSINLELLFSRNGYSYNWSDENHDVDLVINTTSISLPVLIRYSYPSIKGRPFINVGGTYVNNIRNDCQEYEAVIMGNAINIKKTNEESTISSNMLGLTLGAGFQYKVTYKNYASIELRYDKLQGVSHSGSLKETIQLISSFNF